MERAVTVARTNLADDEKNVNRLRVPQFGVVGLSLSINAKQSKTYLQPGVAPAPAAGADDFHFVPDKESITIRYELDDTCAIVSEATLELSTRFKKEPLWTLKLHKLGNGWLAHGKHEVKWDGRTVKAGGELPAPAAGGTTTHDLTALDPDKTDAFPDGYVTLEHSPYKLKLTLKSELLPKKPAVAWTYFQIVLKSIELALGPEEAIPKSFLGAKQLAADKAVRTQIETDGGLPAKAAATPRKIVLPSNLFKKKLSEMDDDTQFDVYKDLWSNGPKIPVIARIRLAASDDAEVKLESDKGAVALGKAQFLWEWEDPDEVATNAFGSKPKAFIDAAINYYKDGTDTRSKDKDHTYPKGDNCHVDRGGKRGPGATRVITEESGYKPADPLTKEDFPFKVEACKERIWGALSSCWTKGKLKGHTGILFRPSRMAGDDYKLRVFLAWDRDSKGTRVLDVKTEPLQAAPALQAETGKFQIWRELHIARYVRKRASIADFLAANLGGIQTAYGGAYISVVDKRGANDTYLVAQHQDSSGAVLDYNALVRKLIKDSSDALISKNYVADLTADHSSVESAFLIRTYSAFVREVHSIENGAAGAGDLNAIIAANPGQTADQVLGGLGVLPIPASATLPPATPQATRDLYARLQRTQNLLLSQGVETDVKYSNQLIWTMPWEKLVKKMEVLSGGRGAEAADGVTILQFSYVHNVNAALAGTAGVTTLLGVAQDVPDASRNRCVFLFFKPDLGTFNHEVGHHLFLPHSKWHDGNGSVPAGAQDDRHDDDDHNCLMSYTAGTTVFCGLCQLRLRGWTAKALDKDDAKNTKP